MIKKRNENKNRREIMKILRIITLIISIPLLSSITLTAANARDCSDPKGFHEKMMCKLQNVKSPAYGKKLKISAVRMLENQAKLKNSDS